LYGLFNDILDDLLSALSDEFDENWEQPMVDQLELFKQDYSQLRTVDRELIDYGTLIAQTAYVYKYCPSRAGFLRQVLERFAADRKDCKFKTDDGLLTVALLGGGPGSEIPAVLDFVGDQKCFKGVKRVNFLIVDKEADWAHIHSLIEAHSKDTKLGEIEFIQHDYLEADDVPDISACDAAILSYVVSEIACTPGEASAKVNLAEMCSTLRSGAPIVYIDNDASSFYYWFNAMRKKISGAEEVQEIKDILVIDYPHMIEKFEEISDATDHPPHLNGKTMAKLVVR
jgi:hypothetical protein